jgi:hypothetical protein
VDYYPNINLRVKDFATPVNWVPAAAASRFGLIKRGSRVHHVATINPPGPIKNGSRLANIHKTISIMEFEANPPFIE